MNKTTLLLVVSGVALALVVHGFAWATKLPAAALGQGSKPNLSWNCWHADSQRADPCGRHIHDLHMLSASNGWAVGNDQLLLRWDGARWTQYPVASSLHLQDVDLLSATEGWVVGRGAGAPVTLHWNGSTWSEVPAPPGAGDLQAVSIVEEGDAWAVGGNAVIHWDGSNWEQKAAPGGYPGYRDVDARATNDVWLAGLQGVLLRWNGSSFITHTLPVPTMRVYDVEVPGPDDVWANARDGGLWHWNGSSWNVVNVPLPPDSRIEQIQMITPQSGWAIQGGWRSNVYNWDGNEWRLHSSLSAGPDTLFMLSGNLGWAAGGFEWHATSRGQILQWNGSEWQGDAGPRFDLVSAVDGLAADDVWAVGAEGTILHYAGNGWSQVQSPTRTILFDVDILSANDGWAAGAGSMLRWDGTEWTAMAGPGAIDVEIVSANAGWAVSHEEILHWNGSSWQAIPLPGDTASYEFRSISMASADDGWAVGRKGYDSESLLLHWDGTNWTEAFFAHATANILIDVEMVSTTDGWLLGQDGLYRWNGSEWNETPHPSPFFLNDIEMASANEGWAAGAGGVLMQWDGVAWALTHAPVAAELSDLAVFSNGVWASGYSNSLGGNVLLHGDGGKWSYSAGEAPFFSASYWDIDFEASGSGWAVGQAMGPGGQGITSHWDGAHWKPVFFPASELLLAVDAATAQNAWAIGRQGNAYHWDGVRWTQVPLYAHGEIPYYGTAVSMTPEGGAWATVNGMIWSWDGNIWSEVMGTNRGLSDIDMLSASEGWAVGDGGVALRWNGIEWSDVYTGESDSLSSVAALAVDNVWAVADSSVFHWNGSEWTSWPLPFDRAGNIAMSTSNDGWVTSFDGESAHWDGSSWTQVPLPTQAFNQGIAYTPDGMPWIASWGYLTYLDATPTVDEMYKIFLPVAQRSREN